MEDGAPTAGAYVDAFTHYTAVYTSSLVTDTDAAIGGADILIRKNQTALYFGASRSAN
jgi:hypothetical protein